MSDDYRFPAAVLLDPLGTRIVLTEDAQQDACLNLRIQPRHGGEPEVIVNRTTAILLRRAIGLWLEHLESGIVPVLEDDDSEG